MYLFGTYTLYDYVCVQPAPQPVALIRQLSALVKSTEKQVTGLPASLVNCFFEEYHISLFKMSRRLLTDLTTDCWQVSRATSQH